MTPAQIGARQGSIDARTGVFHAVFPWEPYSASRARLDAYSAARAVATARMRAAAEHRDPLAAREPGGLLAAWRASGGAREALAAACRGRYQEALVEGSETWSGSTLTGLARGYGARYAESRANLLARAGLGLGRWYRGLRHPSESVGGWEMPVTRSSRYRAELLGIPQAQARLAKRLEARARRELRELPLLAAERYTP